VTLWPRCPYCGHDHDRWLLDLYSGAGGAAMGYHRAGFGVVGMDHRPQPNYPFAFVLGDAMDPNFWPPGPWCAIHASPPCQRFSKMSAVRYALRLAHADLLTPTRPLLEEAGLPWIIENVPGAPMRPDFLLCGCMFPELDARRLRRERWFETSWHGYALRAPCAHRGRAEGVYGYSGPRPGSGIYSGRLARWRAAMGIEWMTALELTQAVPPPYTEEVGRSLAAHLDQGSRRCA
jgi:DNA (cytosine-5)-methyltransferase 1